MNTYADVLLIESNEDDAQIALKALRSGLPTSNPMRLKSCNDAILYLFNEGTLTEQGKNVKLIVSEINKTGGCSVEFLSAIKRNHQTRSIYLFSVLDNPGCLDLFSQAVRAGSTQCLVKTEDFGKKLEVEAGYYWQLFG